MYHLSSHMIEPTNFDRENLANEMKEKRNTKKTVYTYKPLEGSRLKLIRVATSGSYTLEFLEACKAYKKGEQINCMPYDVSIVSNT